MKLKSGFYMEDDGTIWLVYPDGKLTFRSTMNDNDQWIEGDERHFKSAKKTYIGL